MHPWHDSYVDDAVVGSAAGVESGMIMERMSNTNVKLIQKSDLIDTLKNRQLEVLLTVGAGDIDRLVTPIKKALA